MRKLIFCICLLVSVCLLSSEKGLGVEIELEEMSSKACSSFQVIRKDYANAIFLSDYICKNVKGYAKNPEMNLPYLEMTQSQYELVFKYIPSQALGKANFFLSLERERTKNFGSLDTKLQVITAGRPWNITVHNPSSCTFDFDGYSAEEGIRSQIRTIGGEIDYLTEQLYPVAIGIKKIPGKGRYFLTVTNLQNSNNVQVLLDLESCTGRVVNIELKQLSLNLSENLSSDLLLRKEPDSDNLNTRQSLLNQMIYVQNLMLQVANDFLKADIDALNYYILLVRGDLIPDFSKILIEYMKTSK